MPRLRLKDYLVIAGGILLIAVFTLALVASPAAAQTTANGPYYATPSWDQQLPASTRFIVLSNWGSAGVLDRETGLVWEKSPGATAQDWANAQFTCMQKNLGGRGGWKLPSIQELRSLIDPAASNPALPVGHPFTNVQFNFDDAYWSATTISFFPGGTGAWVVDFGHGFVLQGTKSGSLLVWCVRGGPGGDVQ